MAKRQLDIITDTEDKLWYELDGIPESRQGPFDDIIKLSEHLKDTLNAITEERKDKEAHLPGSTDVQTDGKEAEIQKLKE